MPQSSFSLPSRKRSASLPSPPFSAAKEGPSSGIFTADLPDTAPDKSATEEDFSPSGADTPFPPDGSLNANEPFPEDLFRLPVPDWLFSEMVGVSDSALRSLLGLIRLSFRFDPADSTWVKPTRTFTRKEVECETGLSSQGARNGLSELEDAGHVSVDREGRSYQYQLETGVPTSRYTYVPTTFLEVASALSGTDLRLVLVVLRATWGWTEDPDSTEAPGSNENPPAHRRWARLSISDLARRTGRSKAGIKAAAARLQGRFLERLRPTSGAYYYRFLPEALMPEEPAPEGSTAEKGPAADTSSSGHERRRLPVSRRVEASRSMGGSSQTSNELAPDRQNISPPTVIERTFFREARQSDTDKESSSSSEERSEKQEPDAVLEENTTRSRGPGSASQAKEPHSTGESQSSAPKSGETPKQETLSARLNGFSERLQALGKTLAGAGVRPRCLPQLLTRFSAERIEANLQLFRRRAPTVERPGAWLYAAITQGFVLPSPERTGSNEKHSGRSNDTSGNENSSSFLPEPGEKVSETFKRELIRKDLAGEEDFDKFSDYADPDRKQHFFRLGKTGPPAPR